MERYSHTVIKKWFNVVTWLLLISTITSFIMSYFILEKVYTSNAILLVEGEPPIERATSIYSAVAKSDNTMKEVAASLDLDISPKHLSKKIDITSREDMGLIYISSYDSSPEDAHLIVETLIDVVLQQARGMLSDNKLLIIGEAELPQEPFRPKPVFNLILAWAMSIFLSILIVLLWQRYSTTIDDIRELKENIEIDIMGIIPHVRGRYRSIGFVKPDAIEAFKVLYINMKNLFPDEGVILITSPGVGEGKTTIASSLAISMAKSGEKVVFIECDMRRPSIGYIFDIESPYGLSDIFWGDLSLDDAINGTNIANLDIITSGRMVDSPIELFSSHQIRKFFVVMRSRYDYVIVDTPCVLSVADTPLLTRFVDGILMVLEYGKTRKEMFTEACGKLNKVDASVSGIVVNRVPISELPYMKFYI